MGVMSDPSDSARQSVWRLVAAHPELEDRLDLGEVVLRHRHYAPGGADRMWRYDWAGVLQDLRAELPVEGGAE